MISSLRRSTVGISRRAMKNGSRNFSAFAQLPDLSYDYGALEPSISGEIMELHHSKHHQTSVNNYNLACEQYEEAEHNGDASSMIALHGALKFNGGGHINHTLFWENLAPASEDKVLPTEGGQLATMINEQYGSLDDFKAKFNAQTAAVQGSGWGWLGYNTATKQLQIATTANQDPLKATTGLVPLIGIDVWEHAYYLQYRNVRPDYLKAVWEVVNFQVAEERLAGAQ
eukprot:g3618.t1